MLIILNLGPVLVIIDVSGFFSFSLEYHSNMVSDAVKKVIKQGKVRDGCVFKSEWERKVCCVADRTLCIFHTM